MAAFAFDIVRGSTLDVFHVGETVSGLLREIDVNCLGITVDGNELTHAARFFPEILKAKRFYTFVGPRAAELILNWKN